MHIELGAFGDPPEKGSADPDLDIIGVCAKAQNLERLTGLRKGKWPHRDYSAAARQARLSRRFHGMRPCSTISSSIWRSRKVSMARQKPLCL